MKATYFFRAFEQIKTERVRWEIIKKFTLVNLTKNLIWCRAINHSFATTLERSDQSERNQGSP